MLCRPLLHMSKEKDERIQPSGHVVPSGQQTFKQASDACHPRFGSVPMWISMAGAATAVDTRASTVPSLIVTIMCFAMPVEGLETKGSD